MKKAILILVLFLSCYFIYNHTIEKRLNYLVIGDSLAKGIDYKGSITYGYNDFIKKYLDENNLLKEYNNAFTNSDYRIIDIVKALEYNEKKEGESLNYLIKKADIISVSLGISELYYKVVNNKHNIYTYIDQMINNYDTILSYINNFHHQHVFILSYYNIFNINDDIFNYANYKLKMICQKYGYSYVDLSTLFNNNPLYFDNKSSYIPNIDGYERISQIIVEKIKNT